MRLDKYLADMGIGTRTEIGKAVRAGRVSVNGNMVKDAGTRLPDQAEVCLDGKVVCYEPFVFYMMNKPAGILSASEDKKQATVVDLIRDGEAQAGRLVRTDLFPVGRLDMDTEGLLLITNDGQLAHRLLSPKHHIDKTYYARISGTITQADVERFREGIQYDANLTALPAKLELLPAGEKCPEEANLGTETEEAQKLSLRAVGTSLQLLKTLTTNTEGGTKPENTCDVLVTIQEGKFHQIRKMIAALGDGREVLYLKRLTIGSLRLDPALAPGQYRRLTKEEREYLAMTGAARRQPLRKTK